MADPKIKLLAESLCEECKEKIMLYYQRHHDRSAARMALYALRTFCNTCKGKLLSAGMNR